MASAENNVTAVLNPDSLPGWLQVGVTGATWLTESIALTHGQQYSTRRLWVQQHGNRMGQMQIQAGAVGSHSDASRSDSERGDSESGTLPVPRTTLHQKVELLLEEQILKGMLACAASAEGVQAFSSAILRSRHVGVSGVRAWGIG